MDTAHTQKQKMIDCLNPVWKKDYLSIQHVERYCFAITKLKKGQRILDIATGMGYGAALMSRAGSIVTGVDYDGEPLMLSKVYWKHRLLVRANALSLPFPSDYFDAVVTYETIEHVNDGTMFLSEMHRVLKPSGLLICSTPNIQYTFHPPAHVKEYTAEEFFNLVETVFRECEYFGQYFRPVDRFRDLYVRRCLPHPFESIRNIIRSPLIKLGMRDIFRRLLLWNNYPTVAPNAINIEKWLIEISKRAPDKLYRVVPFMGPKWCRIMIVVARKVT